MQRMGEITWLLRHSPGYENADLDRVDALFLQPLLIDQVRVFRKNEEPVGLVVWAFLDAEAEARYLADGVLRADDWKSGQAFWFTDFLAPFGHVAALTRAACRFIPPGQIGYGTRRNSDGSVRRITRHRHVAG
ncbi:toxin-activating lysine-acyltransferase [Roseovarius sp. MMSF_3305]|nr:toxin-activating lysine-acyltransferase [Roseovarius sp. MMSF_3305]